MGVNQTSELYKGFIFDGIDSKGFGVYITGSAVYNAPEREIEAIEIPGRNGAYMLDRGRFHNVTVTYPAGMFARDGEDFADGIRKLRNALASRRGYCKLIDEYNPLEYRMAVYRGGLEVEPTAINGDNKAAQFEIQFDCKPQRFRIDGDQPVKMTDGGVIDNPTLFDAHPLLKVHGYGDITLNGANISVFDTLLGWVTVNDGWPEVSGRTSASQRWTIDSSLFNTGDTIQFGGNQGDFSSGSAFFKLPRLTFNNSTVEYDSNPFSMQISGIQRTSSGVEMDVSFWGATFTAGTAGSLMSSALVKFTNNGTETGRITVRVVIAYDPENSAMTAEVQGTTNDSVILRGAPTKADSSISTLESTTYIDLDIGEAYFIDGDSVIRSSNDHVSLPAELPVLQPGSNLIEYSGSLTGVEIVPRWWEV